jgi:ligand-binding sensor domain-containing protein
MPDNNSGSLITFLLRIILMVCIGLGSKAAIAGKPAAPDIQKSSRRNTLKPRFENLSLKDGLSHPTVFCILRDKRGFMWFGTQNGLNKFNGYDFKTYIHSPNEPESISHNLVRTLCEDSQGWLWVGTAGGGLNRFNRETQHFIKYRFTPEDSHGLSSDFIGDLYEDELGSLWIGTLGGGLARYDRGNNRFIRYFEKQTGYQPGLLKMIDSLNTTDRVISAIDQVEDNQEFKREFIIEDAGQYLVVCQGEILQRTPFDFGWIEKDQQIWQMTDAGSRHAGGDTKNRMQAEIITLDPGQYHLCYKTDDSHAFSTWNTLPPSNSRFWGIRIIKLSIDELEFITSHSQPYQEKSISNNYINCIYQDPENPDVLWIGTSGGLNRFNRKDETFHAYTAFADRFGKGVLTRNLVRCVIRDHEGILWIGLGGGGISRMETGADPEEAEFTNYLPDPDDREGFSYNDVTTLYEDTQHNLWVGTDGGGLLQFDREAEVFIPYRTIPGDPFSISDNYIRSVYEDSSGLLWIATMGAGIDKMHHYGKYLEHYQNNPDDINSLSHNRVLTMYTDHRGNIWIGTDGRGLDCFNPEDKTFRHFFNRPDNPYTLSSNYIPSICESPSGQMWVGTWGAGLNRLDVKTGRCERYVPRHGDPGSISGWIVLNLLVDRSNVLWVGTEKGLDRCDLNNKEGDELIFESVTEEDGIPLPPDAVAIWDISQDSQDMIWISTGSKLIRFNPNGDLSDEQNWVCYQHDPDDPGSLQGNIFSFIYQDKAETFWIGTGQSGINRVILSGGTGAQLADYRLDVAHYTERDGLPSNRITAILSDEEGDLYIGTRKGLAKMNRRTQRFSVYEMKDGIEGHIFNSACCKGEKGELYFGGINGFNVIYPERIEENSRIPPVVLTSLSQGGKKIKLDKSAEYIKEVVFKWPANYFDFEFAALNYVETTKNQYAYMLEGFDQNWNYTGTRRFGKYTNLPTGTYILKVKGSNNNGIWNEEGTTLTVTLKPPFWNTWWFKALSLILLTGLVLSLYKRRLGIVQMKTELQAAHDAQMSIMPQTDPQIPGLDISGRCIPANEVGGDFFDYLWLNEEKSRFGIVIGDVSCKAMSAAMTAVMVSGIINSEARRYNAVGNILTHVNKTVFSKTDRQTFIALCLASFDIRKKELLITNAGLNEPLLLSAGNVKIIEGTEPKYPLGAVEDTNYQETRIPLNKGDVILLFSDGIPDARDQSGRFLGTEDLIAFVQKTPFMDLTAKQIKSDIFGKIGHFTRSVPPFDDMTLVVVKVTA